MADHELILVAGAPGSGKTSIAERFVECGLVPGARHLDIGTLKRAIESGERQSAYREALMQVEHVARDSGAAPSSALMGVMEEFILEQPSGLTLVGGVPRYEDRIAPFKKLVSDIGADVLALCIVNVPEQELLRRLNERPVRYGQKLRDPVKRLEDHSLRIVPTLESLSGDYPTHNLDGTLPLDVNAEELLTIYQRYTQNS